jgi:hypothetical protein
MRFGCPLPTACARKCDVQLSHLAPPFSSGRSSPIPQIVGAEPEDLLRIRAPAGKRALDLIVAEWRPKSPPAARHGGGPSAKPELDAANRFHRRRHGP